MKKKKKKGLFIFLGIIAAVAIGFVVYSKTKGPEIATLKAEQVTYLPLESYISTSGTVREGELFEYVVSGSAMVSEVNVKVGDQVKAGDVLARFDSSDVMDDYKKAAIAYEKVRLNLENSQREYFETMEDIADLEDDIAIDKKRIEDYENSKDEGDIVLYNRYKALYDSNTAEKKALEKSVPNDKELKVQQLGLEEAKMVLDQAQKAVDELPKDIVANCDGVVETRTVQKLKAVEKGAVAFSVRSSKSTAVDFTIGRYDIAKIKLNQPAKIKIGNSSYNGFVSQIGSVASSTATGTTAASTNPLVTARLEVTDANSLFIPGMEADIDVQIYKSEKSLSLPVESVKSDRNGYYCYLLNQEGALYMPVKTYIEVGNSSDTQIEIVSGISEGQLVVANPSKGIESITSCNISR